MCLGRAGIPGKLDNSLGKTNLPELLVRGHDISFAGGVENDLVMDCLISWAE